MNVPLNEVMHFDVITTNPETGEAQDADSAPTYAVYEEDTDTAIVSGTATKRTSLTGHYRGSVTVTLANGFEVGKWYSIAAAAPVEGVTGKAIVRQFRVTAEEATVGKVPATIADAVTLAASQRVKLDAAQPDYAPAKAGDEMTLAEADMTTLTDAIAGVSVTVQPIVGVVNSNDSIPTAIPCYVGETGVAKTVTLVGDDGQPVDLTAFGDLRFVIERDKAPRTDVQVIEHANLTIGGADNNKLTFTPSADVLASAGRYAHSLRAVSTGRTIFDGFLTVTYKPIKDAT